MTAFNLQSIDKSQARIMMSPRLLIAKIVTECRDVLAELKGEHTHRILPRFVSAAGETPSFTEHDLSADPLRFGYDSYTISQNFSMGHLEQGMLTSFRMSLNLFVAADEWFHPCVNIRMDLVDERGNVRSSNRYDIFTPFGFLMAKFTEDAFKAGLSRSDITKAAIFIRQAQAVCDAINGESLQNLIGRA